MRDFNGFLRNVQSLLKINKVPTKAPERPTFSRLFGHLEGIAASPKPAACPRSSKECPQSWTLSMLTPPPAFQMLLDGLEVWECFTKGISLEEAGGLGHRSHDEVKLHHVYHTTHLYVTSLISSPGLLFPHTGKHPRIPSRSTTNHCGSTLLHQVAAMPSLLSSMEYIHQHSLTRSTLASVCFRMSSTFFWILFSAWWISGLGSGFDEMTVLTRRMAAESKQENIKV